MPRPSSSSRAYKPEQRGKGSLKPKVKGSQAVIIPPDFPNELATRMLKHLPLRELAVVANGKGSTTPSGLTNSTEGALAIEEILHRDIVFLGRDFHGSPPSAVNEFNLEKLVLWLQARDAQNIGTIFFRLHINGAQLSDFVWLSHRLHESPEWHRLTSLALGTFHQEPQEQRLDPFLNLDCILPLLPSLATLVVCPQVTNFLGAFHAHHHPSSLVQLNLCIWLTDPLELDAIQHITEWAPLLRHLRLRVRFPLDHWGGATWTTPVIRGLQALAGNLLSGFGFSLYSMDPYGHPSSSPAFDGAVTQAFAQSTVRRWWAFGSWDGHRLVGDGPPTDLELFGWTLYEWNHWQSDLLLVLPRLLKGCPRLHSVVCIVPHAEFDARGRREQALGILNVTKNECRRSGYLDGGRSFNLNVVHPNDAQGLGWGKEGQWLDMEAYAPPQEFWFGWNGQQWSSMAGVVGQR